jgi:hypothetical protein
MLKSLLSYPSLTKAGITLRGFPLKRDRSSAVAAQIHNHLCFYHFIFGTNSKSSAAYANKEKELWIHTTPKSMAYSNDDEITHRLPTHLVATMHAAATATMSGGLLLCLWFYHRTG